MQRNLRPPDVASVVLGCFCNCWVERPHFLKENDVFRCFYYTGKKICHVSCPVYLTWWPWTCVRCCAPFWDNFRQV